MSEIITFGWFLIELPKKIKSIFAPPCSAVSETQMLMPSTWHVVYCRFADLSDEVQKLRPARYIQSDGIMRSYVYRDAEGHQILQVTFAAQLSACSYCGRCMVVIITRSISDYEFNCYYIQSCIAWRWGGVPASRPYCVRLCFVHLLLSRAVCWVCFYLRFLVL